GGWKPAAAVEKEAGSERGDVEKQRFRSLSGKVVAPDAAFLQDEIEVFAAGDNLLDLSGAGEGRPFDQADGAVVLAQRPFAEAVILQRCSRRELIADEMGGGGGCAGSDRR